MDMYFGKEVVNRVSFLRERPHFISASIGHPSARFIFFKNADPLVNKAWKDKLIIATNGDGILTGPEQLSKGLHKLPGWTDAVTKWARDNESHSQALRDELPTFLFLGLEDESVGVKLAGEFLDFEGRYRGIPYYAVDLTHSLQLTDALLKYINEDPSNVFFSTSRKHYLGFSQFQASLYSHGKMFLDWLDRNRFCPGCGSKVIPIHGGGKLQCTNLEKAKCPVQSASVSNVSFPRTDAVIITAITNTDKTKILLSLSKRHKMTNMYSCTSGFMEPSETVEIATKREIWEETGVVCSKISLAMTQPWPFPGNLMIGCIAEVEFNGLNEIIDLGHDNEIQDARWFDIDYVKKLVYPQENNSESNPEGIIIPMPESIAYTLIKLVVDQGLSTKL